jgi:hypothetical protein
MKPIYPRPKNINEGDYVYSRSSITGYLGVCHTFKVIEIDDNGLTLMDRYGVMTKSVDPNKVRKRKGFII